MPDISKESNRIKFKTYYGEHFVLLKENIIGISLNTINGDIVMFLYVNGIKNAIYVSEEDSKYLNKELNLEFKEFDIQIIK